MDGDFNIDELLKDQGERAERRDAVTLEHFWAHPIHGYMHRPTRAFWPGATVNNRVPSILYTKDDGKEGLMDPSRWLNNNRAVEQMTWAPGEPEIIEGRYLVDGGWIDHQGGRCYNLYLPPRVEPGDASQAGPWVNHARLIYPEDADHIIDWLAHRVQRPHEKVNHAIVLGGPPGIGKDTLLVPVRYAVGPWNFAEVSPQHIIDDKFNGFVRSVILRISEAHDVGEYDRFKLYEHTKTLTASPPEVLRCNEKHIREHQVLNVCGVVYTTNYKTDAIYLPAEDRRHYVGWSDRTMEDDCFAGDYWPRLYGFYAAGGINHVAAFLSERDLSKFDPKAPPPKTEAFWAIVDANRAPEKSELSDALDKLEHPDVLTIDMLVAASEGLLGWVRDHRSRRALPRKLERCGMVPVRNEGAKDGLWKLNGKRQVVYGKKGAPKRNLIGAINHLVEQAATVTKKANGHKQFWEDGCPF